MKYFILIMALWASLPQVALSQEESQTNLENLKKQIRDQQERQRQKLDALENAEAKRWNNRYALNAKTKQYEDHIRTLESSYTRAASELTGRQDDLLRSGNETREIKALLDEKLTRRENIRSQIGLSLARSREDLSRDVPVDLGARTLVLSDLSEKLEGGKESEGALMLGYLNSLKNRLEATQTQKLEKAASLLRGKEHRVYRLRLGTVFFGETSLDSAGASQVLLRTGSLQGKIFAWRDNLAGNFNREVADLVEESARGKGSAWVVLDVTQAKSFGTGFTSDAGEQAGKTLAAWFKSGGLVMYPLLALALFGLVLVLERFLVLTSRSSNGKKLMARMQASLQKKDWSAAKKECEKINATLARVLAGVLIKAGDSRQAAEKSLQERVLKEVPDLEKRMTLIAAIGGAAPLLGLLGTVSGMISLFKVITDVGTNDPRILAGGISEALITTQTGLMIAIPLLLLHGFLSDRLDKIQNEISAYGLALLNTIWPEAK